MNIYNNDDKPSTSASTPPEVKTITGGLVPGVRQWALAYDTFRIDEVKSANCRRKQQVDMNQQLPIPWWQQSRHSLVSGWRQLNVSTAEITSSSSALSEDIDYDNIDKKQKQQESLSYSQHLQFNSQNHQIINMVSIYNAGNMKEDNHETIYTRQSATYAYDDSQQKRLHLARQRRAYNSILRRRRECLVQQRNLTTDIEDTVKRENRSLSDPAHTPLMAPVRQSPVRREKIRKRKIRRRKYPSSQRYEGETESILKSDISYHDYGDLKNDESINSESDNEFKFYQNLTPTLPQTTDIDPNIDYVFNFSTSSDTNDHDDKGNDKCSDDDKQQSLLTPNNRRQKKQQQKRLWLKKRTYQYEQSKRLQRRMQMQLVNSSVQLKNDNEYEEKNKNDHSEPPVTLLQTNENHTENGPPPQSSTICEGGSVAKAISPYDGSPPFQKPPINSSQSWPLTDDCIIPPESVMASTTTAIRGKCKRRPKNWSVLEKNKVRAAALLRATSSATAVDGCGVPSHVQRRKSQIPPLIFITPATDDDAKGDSTLDETEIPESCRTEEHTRENRVAPTGSDVDQLVPTVKSPVRRPCLNRARYRGRRPGPLCYPCPPTSVVRTGPRQCRQMSRSPPNDRLLLSTQQTLPLPSLPTNNTKTSAAINFTPEDNPPPVIIRRKTKLPPPSLIALHTFRAQPDRYISNTVPLQFSNVNRSTVPFMSNATVVSNSPSQQLVVDVMNTAATAADSGSDVPTMASLLILEVGGGGTTRTLASSQLTTPSPLEADQQ